jgi:hypothetical protein
MSSKKLDIGSILQYNGVRECLREVAEVAIAVFLRTQAAHASKSVICNLPGEK